ncbi:TolB family protein [Spongiimicrobium sp. 3-5]|uniref:TolB family protein n=1 Tax=Spongiimicrobium sp. 3-5 TaxID=3332596 RepID=UPI00397E9B1F
MKNLLLTLIIILLTNCISDKTELIGHIGRPHISPNGNKIAFIYAKDASKDVWEIYSADINGENVRQLTHFTSARIKKGPVWSPNGEKIAFHADLNEGAQIFVMDSNGENLAQLTDLAGYNVEPNWSPNGNEIVFNTVPKDGKVQMLIMNADGSNIRELHNPDGQNWYPRMTTQNRIVFTSDFKEKDNYDIFSMNLDGSDIRQLTSIDGINWFPEYSPDGTKILFHSNQDDPSLSDSGNFNLYMINADGTGLRQITSMAGQELHAKWHPLGKKLIFEWHHEGAKGLHMFNLTNGTIEKIKLVY